MKQACAEVLCWFRLNTCVCGVCDSANFNGAASAVLCVICSEIRHAAAAADACCSLRGVFSQLKKCMPIGAACIAGGGCL